MTARVLHGDCLELIGTLPENSIDAVVTDPPYHLTSIVKRFGSDTAAPAQFGTDGAFARASRGFMGKTWDGGDIAMRPETWAALLAVMKPGAHLAAFGGTRTFHRMAVAIEDAGFEIRDCLSWVYGTGFPKSLDVSKAIDKAARGVPQGGADPTSANHGRYKSGCSADNPTGRGFGAGPGSFMAEAGERIERELVAEAAQWSGWGTALKPSWEPIILARKPLVGTVAANVLAHGCGAINVDACRIGTTKGVPASPSAARNMDGWGMKNPSMSHNGKNPEIGRWPANLVHDGSAEVEAAFAAFGERPGQLARARTDGETENNNVLGSLRHITNRPDPRADSGTASRFFYCAKASTKERQGSKHPTVKPLSLMRWLITLVVPPGGTLLDPFAGSGSTGVAAEQLGFDSVLIEREPEYVEDIRRRIAAEALPLT